MTLEPGAQGTRSQRWLARLSFALAFPNIYRLGMSNLGYQLVYRLLNEREDTVCERVFLPDPLDQQEFRRSRMPLISSRRPSGSLNR